MKSLEKNQKTNVGYKLCLKKSNDSEDKHARFDDKQTTKPTMKRKQCNEQ